MWTSDLEFITYGVKHLKFFSIKGSRLDCSAGLFGKVGIVANFGIAQAWGKLFSGTQNGSLIEWSGRNAVKVHKV